ncbi:MAG TPA: VWA domain-containing protein [Meiothermus sp.]|nr:VWA domain-containing protein [Meiothermus sp.]
MRRAIQVIVALAFLGAIAAFFLYTPTSTVQVLIWTSGEKQNVLKPALERFNQQNRTVTVGARRYEIEAKSVTVNSGEMFTHLVRKLAQGVEFPERTEGAPTVVSPSTSDWLAQVNLEVGKNVFDMANLESIVRTPVVIFTFREMAECLGWPAKPVGWGEILALAENPKGWATCPEAKAEWGRKPKVAFTDPTVSSTARSTLQLLYLAKAGKKAEELTLQDVGSETVRGYVRRFQATVDHYYPETLKLQTKMFQGPRFVHFAPVEEYVLPWLYQGRVNAESVPGGKVVQRPISELGYEVVALYPKEGTVWHDNPFAIPNAEWVFEAQRAAAKVVQEYLMSDEVQREFVAWGFRPGSSLDASQQLTSRLGVNLAEPKRLLGRLKPEVAQAIQRSWEDVKKPGVAVLVLDTSGSMSGSRLQEAKEGAKRFLDRAAPGTYVGLVTFASNVEVRVPIGPLAKTRFQIVEAIDELQAKGNTALYQAVKEGLELADAYTGVSGEAIRGVVLLSDGLGNAGTVGISGLLKLQDRDEREVRLEFPGEGALKNIVASGLAFTPKNPVHVFSVGVGEADWDALRLMAEATGGVVSRSGEQDLGPVLERFSKYF